MSELTTPSPRALVCFDFDLTLTDTHLFRLVTQMIQAGAAREQACMKGIAYLEERGPRGGERLWDLLYALLMRGHGLAVCTFTSYPELAMAMWQRGVKPLRARGAPREVTGWLSRPIVVYGDPDPRLRPPLPVQGAHLVEVGFAQMASYGKQTHIERALMVAQERLEAALDLEGSRALPGLLPPPSGVNDEPFQRVILLDDDPRNIEHASQRGFEGIFVSPPEQGDEHLDRLAELLGLSLPTG